MCNDQRDYDGDNDKCDTKVHHEFEVFEPQIIRQSIHLDGFDKFLRVLFAFKPVIHDFTPLVEIGVPQVLDTCVGLREIRSEHCKLLIDLRELRIDLREFGCRCRYRGHRRGERRDQHHHIQHRRVHLVYLYNDNNWVAYFNRRFFIIYLRHKISAISTCRRVCF